MPVAALKRVQNFYVCSSERFGTLLHACSSNARLQQSVAELDAHSVPPSGQERQVHPPCTQCRDMHTDTHTLHPYCPAQTRRQRERTENTVKGSQGAGKVNEALDRTRASAGDGETKGSPSKPALPQRPKGKGRR